MRRPALSGQRGMRMSDMQCPAPVDATEIEQMACKPAEPVKPTKPGEVTPQSGGGGTTNPPQPPKKD